MYGASWTSLILLAFLVQATLGAQFCRATATKDRDATESVQADSGLDSQAPLECRLQILTAPAPDEHLGSMRPSARSSFSPPSCHWNSSLQLVRVRLQV